MDAYAHQWFDPALFFIVCYDQRGAGGSVPNAAHDLDGALFENTTQHLVDDLDTLRVFLGIERWHVMGHSWSLVILFLSFLSPKFPCPSS